MSATIERHIATVTGVDDPEKRGRIRVTCPGIMGDDETELPMFVEPVIDWGLFVVPNIGEIVEIECTGGSSTDESYGQTSISQLNPRWRGSRFYDVKSDSPAAIPHPDFTDINYGQRRGFHTKRHTLVFDDTEGQESISLTWRNKGGKDIAVTIEDGIVSVAIEDGPTLALHANGSDTTAKIGDGTMHVAIAEHLQALYESMKATTEATFNGHVHPSAMGPTGPPAPPLSMPAWDPTINSTKVSLPDG